MNKKTKRTVITVKKNDVLEIRTNENNGGIIITNKNGILQVESI